MSNLPIILLFLSTIVTTYNRGFFSFPGLALLLMVFIILLIIFLQEVKLSFPKSASQLLCFLLVIIYIQFTFFSGGIYQEKFLPSIFLTFLPLLFLPLIITYLAPRENIKERKIRFLTLFSLAALLRFLIVFATPAPLIDVFTILKEAPLKLVALQNPYDTVYSPVYPGITTDYFPYWPAAFLLELPFILLFGDPRILLILADLGSALLLYLFGKRTRSAELLSLIYLFRPNSLFIIEQSWLTPLIFFLIVVSFYLFKKNKEILSGFSLGIATAIQPYLGIILPLVLAVFGFSKKIFFSFLTTLVFILAPFFLWNEEKFIDKTILVYFKPLEQIPTIPIHLSLNLNTFIFTIFGKDIPLFLSSLSIIFLFLLIFYRLLSARNDQLALALTLFFYGFYLLFRQSFINYYYLSGSLLILWLRWRLL